jgi:hypothetical protein
MDRLESVLYARGTEYVSLLHKGSELGLCAEREALRRRMRPYRPPVDQISHAGMFRIGERESRIGFVQQAHVCILSATQMRADLPVRALWSALWKSAQFQGAQYANDVRESVPGARGRACRVGDDLAKLINIVA